MRKRPHETEQRDGRTDATIPDPQKPISEQAPVVLLAMCLFGEARGEADSALRAVAQVVLNRTRHPHPVFGSRPGAAWEENLRRVILRPGQFSSFHPGDPNYSKLLRPHEAEDSAAWARCVRCAEEALAAREQADAVTANSDHYFDDSIQPPSWADPAKRTVKLGRLNFYRLYLPPPGSPISIGVSPLPSGNGLEAGSTERDSAPPPAHSPLPPAETFPTQEPPQAEPSSAARSSAAKAADGAVPLVRDRAEPSPVAGPGKPGSPHTMSLPRRVPPCAWLSRLPQWVRVLRAGRLSSPKAVTSDKSQVTGLQTARRAALLTRRSSLFSLVTRHSSLVTGLVFCLLLAACSEFERTAYRTLAVTKAEYETIQSRVAEAAAHGLITEEQWNRFSAEGHRFIASHNAAVDAFELWSRLKSSPNQARVAALLEILPRLVRELNGLADSFQSEPSRPAGSRSGQARDSEFGIRVFSRVASPETTPRWRGRFARIPRRYDANAHVSN
jgi:spore germination cell wall hydrolase CwlJ-like protein